MRRMFRPLPLVAVALPVAMSSVWMLSHYYRFAFDYRFGHGRVVQLAVERGMTFWVWWYHDGETVGPRGAAAHIGRPAPVVTQVNEDEADMWLEPEPQLEMLGLRYAHQVFPPQTVTNNDESSYTFRRGGVHQLNVPLWTFVLVCTLPGVFMLARWRRSVSRAHRGKCPRCGYDLRASTAGCPECGDSSHDRPMKRTAAEGAGAVK